jgi:hypothetical protein
MADFVVRCDNCNEELEAYFEQYRSGGGAVLNVKPCKICLQDAEKKGDEAGYDRGSAELSSS